MVRVASLLVSVLLFASCLDSEPAVITTTTPTTTTTTAPTWWLSANLPIESSVKGCNEYDKASLIITDASTGEWLALIRLNADWKATEPDQPNKRYRCILELDGALTRPADFYTLQIESASGETLIEYHSTHDELSSDGGMLEQRP